MIAEVVCNHPLFLANSRQTTIFWGRVKRQDICKLSHYRQLPAGAAWIISSVEHLNCWALTILNQLWLILLWQETCKNRSTHWTRYSSLGDEMFFFPFLLIYLLCHNNYPFLKLQFSLLVFISFVIFLHYQFFPACKQTHHKFYQKHVTNKFFCI